ncbi:alanine racemase [Lachnospiraceae bacterium 47-T17]
MTDFSRVCAYIDLDAAVHNMEQMHALVDPRTKLMAVVKTDGYGHGAIPLARELEGLDYVYGFAVATAEEGLALRRDGRKKPILILGAAFEKQYDAILRAGLCPTVFSFEAAQALSKAAEQAGVDARVHIKLDTGMGRIGFDPTEASVDAIARIASLPHMMIEGIFTHLARADERDKTSATEQIELFLRMTGALRERGIDIPLRHCSNSAGILDLPGANLELVRAGITLYGLHPSKEVHLERMDMRPVLSLKSRIVHVKCVPAGTAISYGGTYVTEREQRIATIPVGYGDGYARSLSNCGDVLICGRRAPIRGRVCMDQFMVDVTHIPEAGAGAEVTLIGADGDDCITMEELGDKSGRFNYEFACDLGKRIPRVFVRGGRGVLCWTQYEGLLDSCPQIEPQRFMLPAGSAR